MAMISPALESMMETLSTVKFASRAKNVKNQPVVNEDLDQKVRSSDSEGRGKGMDVCWTRLRIHSTNEYANARAILLSATSLALKMRLIFDPLIE